MTTPVRLLDLEGESTVIRRNVGNCVLVDMA
jgi:hypothetical protein